MKWFTQRIVCKKNIWIVLYAVLFSLADTVGSYVYETNTLAGFFANGRLTQVLLQFVGIAVLVFFLLLGILWLLKKLTEWEQAEGGGRFGKRMRAFFGAVKRLCLWKGGLILWVLFFLAWLPCYISYFPGVLAYDANSQLYMRDGVLPLTSHHPPLHTFFFWACLSLGEMLGSAINKGVVIYSVIQIAVFSFTISRLVYAMAKRMGGVFLSLTILFFALNPVMALFSFSTTKDVWFAMTLIGLFTQLLTWAEDPEQGCIWKTVLWAVLCCLLRNNFIYAWGVGAVLFVIRYCGWKRFGRAAVLSVLVTLAITKLGYPALGIGEGMSREKLSVPMQQVSRVVHDEGITQEQTDILYRYMNVEMILNEFNPRLADPVKDTFRSEYYDENPGEFWELYWELFEEYPADYVGEALTLNIPYWYPRASVYDSLAKRDYVETSPRVLWRQNLLPAVYDWYESIAKMTSYEGPLLFEWMFALATPLWLLLALIAALPVRQRRCYVRCLLPPLFYVLTFFLGPVSNTRYIFPIMVLYPLLLALPFLPRPVEDAELHTLSAEHSPAESTPEARSGEK